MPQRRDPGRRDTMARHIGQQAYQILITCAGVMPPTRSPMLGTRREGFIRTARGHRSHRAPAPSPARGSHGAATGHDEPGTGARWWHHLSGFLGVAEPAAHGLRHCRRTTRGAQDRDHPGPGRAGVLAILKAINPSPVCRCVDRDRFATDFCHSNDHPPLEDKAAIISPRTIWSKGGPPDPPPRQR